jgi:UPF0271 protein
MKFDLNCDLGEQEPSELTRTFMELVTSANIACGGHAGDAASMKHCVELAQQHCVLIGAHPGPLDKEHFGRKTVNLSPETFALVIEQQLDELAGIAQRCGAALHHVKLHGAFYHMAEENQELAESFLQLMASHFNGVIVYAQAEGLVQQLAPAHDVEVWPEAFLDRNYRADRSLVPRDQPNALLSSPELILQRLEEFARNEITAMDGKRIRVKARTLCVHSDSPRAVETSRIASEWLRSHHG